MHQVAMYSIILYDTYADIYTSKKNAASKKK